MIARPSTPEMRNPARSGVSSVRIHLPATGADLLRGGRAPSRLLCTALVYALGYRLTSHTAPSAMAHPGDLPSI